MGFYAFLLCSFALYGFFLNIWDIFFSLVFQNQCKVGIGFFINFDRFLEVEMLWSQRWEQLENIYQLFFYFLLEAIFEQLKKLESCLSTDQMFG